MRKKLPSLGVATVESRSKDEEDKQVISTMEDHAQAKRIELIKNGKRNEMSLKQARYAPQLNVNEIIQHAFRCANDTEHTCAMEWHTRTITKVSGGANLRNASSSGPKFYRKGGAVEFEWCSNEDKGEEVSYSIVEIKKKLFNSYVESGQRLCFLFMQWNNKLLQSKFDLENNDEEED